MFLYEKKIIYLSRYQGEKKESGAGFIRITEKSNEWCIDIQVKGEVCRQGSEYALYFLVGNEEIFMEKLSVQASGILYHRGFWCSGERISFQGKEYSGKDILGVEIRNGSEIYIAGYLKEPETGNGHTKPMVEEKKEAASAEKESESVQETDLANSKEREIRENSEQSKERARQEVSEQSKEWERQELERAVVFATNLEREPQEIRSFDNKWEQLINDYPQIHPFGDDRVFITIEPKDFIVLQASYQKLVNNSFLLHGFYNYRYLILGPDMEIGESDKECYYLGVPGTYFEREKMVAVMFGFEGFECAGPVEIGKFGFYMRRVEL